MTGIFKAYDIRGIFPDNLNEDIAYKIARAFVVFLGVNEVVLGRDCRTHSPVLYDAVVKGITDQGANVIDIGKVSTPMLYFAVANFNKQSGLMITASHNKKEYNGVKLVREKAIPLSESTGIKEIQKLVEENNFVDAKEKGNVETLEIFKDYVAHVLSFSGKVNPLNVVIDYSNGMASVAGRQIFDMLKINCFELNKTLDGTFPNHEPNPLKESAHVALREKIKKENADIGIIFDGDADRVVFMTGEGEAVNAAYILPLLAEVVFETKPHALVIYDLRMSKIVSEKIRSLGGRLAKTRVGHSFIKQTMRETNGSLGGELSGHYFFDDNFFCDDPMIAAVHILNLLTEKNQTLTELITPLKKYAYSGEINFKVKDKDEVLGQLANKFSDAQVETMDGVTISYSDWWFNVRPSNTEPVIRLVVEAKTDAELKEHVSNIKEFISNFS